MQLEGKVVVVTGGGGGIGAALCRRFRQEGAAALVVADLNAEAAEVVAAEVGGTALCPQGVRTAMLGMDRERPFLQEGALEPEEVAAAVVDALRQERFLVLPHPEVAEYFRRKATDYDRWLRGMRRLRERVLG